MEEANQTYSAKSGYSFGNQRKVRFVILTLWSRAKKVSILNLDILAWDFEKFLHFYFFMIAQWVLKMSQYGFPQSLAQI